MKVNIKCTECGEVIKMHVLNLKEAKKTKRYIRINGFTCMNCFISDYIKEDK